MKTLTLIRHAKSSWDDPGIDDHDRPLNARGKREAPLMAAFFARLPGPPGALVSSPAVRALATARIFAKKLGRAAADIVQEPAIYEAHWSVLLDAVHAFPPDWNHACLFGHNPGFEELARNLTGEPIAGVPTCSILELDLRCSAWKQAQKGKATLSRYFFPKMFVWGNAPA